MLDLVPLGFNEMMKGYFRTLCVAYSLYAIGNMLMLLVVGPPCEARYGSGRLGLAMLATALVSGLLHWALFPGTALLGASGIVFMLIILSSFAGAGRGELPLTLLLVLVLYLGGELVSMLTVRDNISHLSHILGGLCGAGFGFLFPPVCRAGS